MIEKGSKLVLFTDGILEVGVLQNTALGLDGLKRAIVENKDKKSAEFLSALVTSLEDVEQDMHDDITMISIDRV